MTIERRRKDETCEHGAFNIAAAFDSAMEFPRAHSELTVWTNAPQ